MESLAVIPSLHGECVNLKIPQQQLQLPINCSKGFGRPVVDILARVTFGTATISKELLFRST